MGEPKLCIAFAGAIGSSKTPIATYLSWNLGLPIVSNDVLRSEVTEDLGEFDQKEYEKRLNERRKRLTESGKSFIYDASIDREWPRLQEWLQSGEYTSFVISLDLSKTLLTRLHKTKGYSDSLKRLDDLIRDHQRFVQRYGNAINLRIEDSNFAERLDISLAAARKWIDSER